MTSNATWLACGRMTWAPRCTCLRWTTTATSWASTTLPCQVPRNPSRPPHLSAPSTWIRTGSAPSASPSTGSFLTPQLSSWASALLRKVRRSCRPPGCCGRRLTPSPATGKPPELAKTPSLGCAERRMENRLRSARLGRLGVPSTASVCTSTTVFIRSGEKCPQNPNKSKNFSFKLKLVQSVDMAWGGWAKVLQWVWGEALSLLFWEETVPKNVPFPAQMGWCIPRVTF